MENHESFFSWDEPISKKEVNKDWLWALGVIAVFGAATAFLLDNFLFGVFILLAALVLYLTAKKEKDNEILIGPRGIIKEGTLYPYKTIDGFWIDIHGDEGVELLIHTSRMFFPVVSVVISDNIDLDSLHDFLAEILEERQMHEPKLYRLLDRLGL